MEDREKNLPGWAKVLIAELRRRVETEREALVRDNTTLTARNKFLESKIGALEELLTCAAKGGHKTATEIIDVFASYSLAVAKDE